MIILFNASSDWSRESGDKATKHRVSWGINIMCHIFGNLGICHSKCIKKPICLQI